MHLPSIKILTVDNSVVVADRLRAIFSEVENTEYLGNAINASEAQILINEQKPEVVFLDIHLETGKTKTNGMNLLVAIRKQYPKIKIIMLTNLAGIKYKETCLAFGADYFLDKTLDFDKIPETLKKIIHSK